MIPIRTVLRSVVTTGSCTVAPLPSDAPGEAPSGSQSFIPVRLASAQVALLSQGEAREVEMGFEFVIGINASEERVWAALTDVEHWP